jgi:amino acid adenylation domain-containing protein
VRPFLLHQLLERAAAVRPGHVAVEDRNRHIAYGELDARANQLARRLQALGVRRGDRVAMFIDKSVEAVVAVYGILKSGGAYVPLDPQAPVARLAYIASNCGVRCLVSESDKSPSWPALIAGAPSIEAVVTLDGEPASTQDANSIARPVSDRAAVDREPPDPIETDAIDLDVAYILYTSGSTGEPKGVTLTHRNAMAFVEWAVDAFTVGPHDRLSSHAPFHFDLSVFDLYAAVMAQATVVLVPPRTSHFPIEIKRFIDRTGVTVWYSVPSVLTQLVLRGDLAPGDLPSLRAVLFAGEVFPTKFLRQLMALLPSARFVNLYGPTETNVCTWYDVPPLPTERDDDIPIGKAIANTQTIVVTEDGRLASAGEVGELYVRGATVMQGYWGDGERTARALVQPATLGSALLTDRAYRTGDLVQEDPGGNLRFLGRRDGQIKSRGYRIELGEIESVINAHPSIVECAVVAIPDDLITNRIKAFVATSDDLVGRDLARWCGDRLPRYMIPEDLEVRRSLPRTSTGKTDRKLLQDEARGTDTGDEFRGTNLGG